MRLLALALLTLLAACHQSVAPQARHDSLNRALLAREFPALAGRAGPGMVAAAVMDMQSGQAWTWNGEQAMPMQSVFKAPLGAAVLARVDEGTIALTDVITLRAADLSPGHSPVADAFPAVSQYTVRDLLERAVGESDNTAADVLMARIGGPGMVTAWLQEKSLQGIRIDRSERDIAAEMSGLHSFRPEWIGAGFAAATAAVPDAERRAAQAAYMADPRDRMSPQGAMQFLSRLQRGELLSPGSTAILLSIMARTRTGPDRIRAGLPPGAALVHKTGTSGTQFGITPAVNDIGIVTLPGGQRYVIAVFVSGSAAGEAAAETIIADATRLFVRAIRP